VVDEGETGDAPTPLRILITVTFNANQLRSHLLPILALPEVARVTLVADVEPPALPKLRSVVPPRLLVRTVGRAAAKLLACLWVAARERPDWVVGFNLVPHGFNARVVGALTGTKSLYHMIGGEEEWLGGGWRSDNAVLGRLRSPSHTLERLLLRLIAGCTVVATMGESARSSLIDRGIDESRIRILRPSVDTRRFAPSSNPADPRYDIVTVGELIPRKRIGDLIRAAAELRARRHDLQVGIVGAGPLEVELRHLVSQLGVTEHIAFLGFREDVQAIYRTARIFALTSASEGLPIAMLEAMSSGLPPVVSDVGEVGGFIRDGENGLLFPAGDVDALTARLETRLGDESLRTALGAAAAGWVEESASVDAVATEYRRLFSSSPSATGTRTR
jgi:glycosyltransferase involved in cell wall biosynthesis